VGVIILPCTTEGATPVSVTDPTSAAMTIPCPQSAELHGPRPQPVVTATTYPYASVKMPVAAGKIVNVLGDVTVN
jgi:hypothetical protein